LRDFQQEGQRTVSLKLENENVGPSAGFKGRHTT
jgi:hypothetical protein